MRLSQSDARTAEGGCREFRKRYPLPMRLNPSYRPQRSRRLDPALSLPVPRLLPGVGPRAVGRGRDCGSETVRMLAVSDGEWCLVAGFDGINVVLLDELVNEPQLQLAVLLMLARASEEWENVAIGGLN